WRSNRPGGPRSGRARTPRAAAPARAPTGTRARAADPLHPPRAAAVPADRPPPPRAGRGDRLLGLGQAGPLEARPALAALRRGRLVQAGPGESLLTSVRRARGRRQKR